MLLVLILVVKLPVVELAGVFDPPVGRWLRLLGNNNILQDEPFTILRLPL